MYGFDHDFLLLFPSYLCNRSYCVRVNAHISNPRPVTSGVSQGPILRLLLSLFFYQLSARIFRNFLLSFFR